MFWLKLSWISFFTILLLANEIKRFSLQILIKVCLLKRRLQITLKLNLVKFMPCIPGCRARSRRSWSRPRTPSRGRPGADIEYKQVELRFIISATRKRETEKEEIIKILVDWGYYRYFSLRQIFKNYFTAPILYI